jgi:hypothetical protein
MHSATISLFAAASLVAAHAPHTWHANNADIIESDVVVIGGGSGGTYCSIRLQQLNKTVTLIERENRLGGHVNTYVDKATGETFDYGVISYDGDLPVVQNYLAHLNVSTGPPYFSSPGPSYTANFADGSLVTASATNATEAAAAYQRYLEQAAKYPYLANGFDLPHPVPEDLLLTFGDFVAKYNLGSIVFTLATYGQGVGNILAQQALYIVKYLPAETVTKIAGTATGWVTSASHDNQEIYNKALAKLGASAFLNSNVTKIVRSSDGVSVFFTTPSGQKQVKASKLVVAIPPKMENLGFLDLDKQESSIFSQFNNSYYWDAVVKGTGFPVNSSVSNVNPAAPYGLPSFPGIYEFGAAPISDLFSIYYSSPYYISDEDVKADILATDARLVKGLGFPATNSTLEIVGFNLHSPFFLTVCKEAIEDGFYAKLQALQGEKNTWWTGAAWQAPDSSLIWNYTESMVLPPLLKSL